MKRYLLILFLFCSFGVNLFAQIDDEESPPPMVVNDETSEVDPEIGRIILEGGITRIRPFRLNDALFGTGNNRFREFTTIGFAFGMADETHPQSADFIVGTDVTWGFNAFLAQQYRGDTLNGAPVDYKLKGWEIMTSSIAVNLVRNEHVDLIFGVGMFYGNLKLFSENLNTNTTGIYKNPFVGPLGRTELRFNFGRLTFGSRLSYRFDWTKDKWRSKDDTLPVLPGYKFQDVQFMFYIGLRELYP